jgi:hypothetical protein
MNPSSEKEESVKPKTGLAVLLLLLVSAPSFGKKIKPEEFTDVAKVVEVSLQELTRGMKTEHPALPAFCSNPEAGFQKSFCQSATASGDATTVKLVTYYLLKTEIGDKEYDLRGTLLLQLGTYPAKFLEASRRTAASVVFLSKDKKGKLITAQYQIVGVRMKTAEKAE